MQPQLRNAGALTFCLEYSRGAPNNVDTHGGPLPAVSVVWNGPARMQLVPKHSFTLTRQKTVKARVALGQAASFRPENTHTPGANERRLQVVEEECDVNEEARPGCTAGSGHLAGQRSSRYYCPNARGERTPCTRTCPPPREKGSGLRAAGEPLRERSVARAGAQ